MVIKVHLTFQSKGNCRLGLCIHIFMIVKVYILLTKSLVVYRYMHTFWGWGGKREREREREREGERRGRRE